MSVSPRHAIEAWSDGNPCYIDEAGKKQYAYHQDHELLARCIDSDTPHPCRECGAEFVVDSRSPIQTRPECGASEIAATLQLVGAKCPYCKEGVFQQDPGFCAIS